MPKIRTKISGFTLAEVLVVLAIIGIACMVIVPQISNTDHMQAVSAGREVVSTLLFAQTMSVTKQDQYQVVFNTGTNNLEVQRWDAGGSAWVAAADPLKVGQTYHVNFSGDGRYRDVTIESAVFGDDGTVWFDAFGAPGNGINLLAAPGAVVLRAGENRVQVNVEPISGRITIVEL